MNTQNVTLNNLPVTIYYPKFVKAVDNQTLLTPENISNITLALTNGSNIKLFGLDVTQTSSTSFVVSPGIAIVDNVVIQIQEPVAISIPSNLTGTYYIVLAYSDTPLNQVTYYPAIYYLTPDLYNASPQVYLQLGQFVSNYGLISSLTNFANKSESQTLVANAVVNQDLFSIVSLVPQTNNLVSIYSNQGLAFSINGNGITYIPNLDVSTLSVEGIQLNPQILGSLTNAGGSFNLTGSTISGELFWNPASQDANNLVIASSLGLLNSFQVNASLTQLSGQLNVPNINTQYLTVQDTATFNQIVIENNPTIPTQAATKSYVDANVNTLNTEISNMTLQQVYNQTAPDTSSSASIVLNNNKNFRIYSENGSSVYFEVNAQTGLVSVAGDVNISGSTSVINSTVIDEDHLLLSPSSASTIALQINPETNLTSNAIQVAVTNNGPSVFTVGPSGTTTIATLSVSGTLTSIGNTLLGDTSGSTVKTYNNTLDDGSGNVSIIGTLNASTVTTPTLTVTGNTLLANSSGATLKTFHNTLDDGTGNATIIGTLNANGGINTNNANINLGSGTLTANTIDVTNLSLSNTLQLTSVTVTGSGTVDGIFTVYGNTLLGNTSGSTVKTFHNTLDDGSGNTIIVGNTSITGALSVTSNVTINGTLTASATTVSGLTNSGNETISGTFTTTGNALLANASGNTVKTYHNTLDDGSGNVTISGNTSIVGALSASATTLGSLNVTGNTSLVGTLTTTGNTLLANASGNTVKTYNNTLDDGSGNVTISGSMNVAGNTSLTGSVTAFGTLTVNGFDASAYAYAFFLG